MQPSPLARVVGRVRQAQTCRFPFGIAAPASLVLAFSVAALGADTLVWTNAASANWSASGAWLGAGVPPVSGSDVEFVTQAAGIRATSTVDAAWCATGSVNSLAFQQGNIDATRAGTNVLAGSGLTSFTIGAGGVKALNVGPTPPQRGEIPTSLINTPVTLSGSQSWYVLAPVVGSVGQKIYNGIIRPEAQLTVLEPVNGAGAGTVFTKSGAGRFDLRGANGALGSNVSEFVLGAGSVYLLNGTAAGNNANRIPDACKITSDGGAFVAGQLMSGGTEDMGQLTLRSGLFWFEGEKMLDGTPSGSTVYRFASLNPMIGPAAAAVFDVNVNSDYGSIQARFQDVSGFPNNDGIVGGWAWNGTTRTWLAPPTANGNLAGVAGQNRSNADINSAAAVENVTLVTDATITLTANRTFNSLRAGAGSSIVQTLNLGGFELRLDAGAFANSWSGGGFTTFTMTNGRLTVGAADNSGGTLYVAGGGTGLTTRDTAFSSTCLITDNGSGVVNLVAYRPDSGGSLILSGTNTYSGFTALLKNAVKFASDGVNPGDGAPLGKVPATFTADNIRLVGGDLFPTAAVTLHPNRGIQLAGPGGALSGAALSHVYNGAISGSGDLFVDVNNASVGWTLGGTSPNTFEGRTIIRKASLYLNKTSGTNAIPGDVFILDEAQLWLSKSEQIADTAVISFGSQPGYVTYLHLNGNSETIGGLVGTQSSGNQNPGMFVQNDSQTTASTVTVSTVSGSCYRFGGRMYNGWGGAPKALAFMKTGAGTQELLRDNTYTGGTTVNGGTLRLSNTNGSATGTGPVSVGASGILAGTGIVKPTGANAITVSGTVAPGASVGTLTLDLGATSAGVTLASGAKLACELAAPGAGDTVKFLNFGVGDLTLNDNVIDIADAGGLAVGTYTLLEFCSDAGTTLTDTGKPTSGLTIGNKPSAMSCRIDYSEAGKINLVVSSGGTAIILR